jgi:menaquinone-dependent protoporphyrinogen oxidase
MKVLITAGSKHGSTAEIAETIAAEMAGRGLDVICRPPGALDSIAGYDAVVIGSAVYAGRWRDEVKEFVERHAAELKELDVWLFSSGPLGDPPKPAEDPVDAATMIAETDAREHRLFAGKLDKSELNLGERALVRAVKAPYGDFRDREAIRAWAAEITSFLVGIPAT